MATKKKATAKIIKKTTEVVKTKKTDFIGVWQSFKSTFEGIVVEQKNISTFTIVAGYVYMYNGGATKCKCKISGNKIEIPAGATIWKGEMLPNSVLRICTENGMGCFYCIKVSNKNLSA